MGRGGGGVLRRVPRGEQQGGCLGHKISVVRSCDSTGSDSLPQKEFPRGVDGIELQWIALSCRSQSIASK